MQTQNDVERSKATEAVTLAARVVALLKVMSAALNLAASV